MPGVDPFAMIAGQLRALVRNACKSIEWWLPFERTEYRYGEQSTCARANFDRDLHHFTYMSFDPDFQLPWLDEEAWEDHEITEDLEDVSATWLKTVGLSA